MTPAPTYEQLYAWLIEAESHVALLEAALARIGGAVGTVVSAGYVRQGLRYRAKDEIGDRAEGEGRLGAGVGDDFEPPSL